MTPRIHALPETQAIPAPAAGPRAWPRGWRAAAGLTSVAAGAVILAGAFLPWVEAFAGLVQVPGVRGINGQILAAAGALIAVTGLYQLVRGGQAARWITGLTGFAAVAFSGYLLIQLAKTMRVLGSDSMVIARSGPGLWVAAAGSAAAFATLFFPPSSQATLRRDTGRPALAWVADRDSAGLRRGLQVALGIVWLADAALQYQPYMFTKASTASMLMPMATGEPAFVSGPVLTTMRLMTEHVAAWNALFATIQLALAVGLLWRPTARVALAGTIAWSLSVWWLGEGLGGIFSGMANPLTGAPGAALLYALLAILIWPAVQSGRTGPSVASASVGQRASVAGASVASASVASASVASASVAGASPLGRVARLAWFILWGTMAGLMLAAPARSASLTAPGGTQATVVTIGFAAVFALTAVGVFLPATVRPALLLAVLAALVIWATSEDFGKVFSGSATDVNTGPLLLLIALAYWPTGSLASFRRSPSSSPA